MIGALGILLAFLFFASPAMARDPAGVYAQSPYRDWFKNQHNSVGQWCCDEADGHPYYEDYTLDKDGSVIVQMNGKPYRIESYKVLSGTNPTGHAVWWYLDGDGGRTTYCFALGQLG